MDAEASQNPQSILMTTDTVGGVWTFSLTLARALRRHGVAVHLATMGAPLSSDQRRQAAALDNISLFESNYRLEWMDNPWDSVRRAADWLLFLEDRTCPDLVHLNGYVHAAEAWSSPVLVVAHSCVLSWWRAVKNEDAPHSWNRYRDEVRHGVASAELVVAPSRAMLDALALFYRVPFEGLVIPNGCDPALFAPATKEPLIFSAGRLWDEAKNISALDQIAERLSWPVYIAGDQQHPNGGRVEKTAGAAKLLGRLGSEAARDWYARASIYVLPAKYEPFGLSVLEAAQSGCALVLGDIPSLRENWDDAALFVDPGDCDALRDAIELLTRDDGWRSEFSRRARERGAAFTPECMAAAYMDGYRRLMAARELRTCA